MTPLSAPALTFHPECLVCGSQLFRNRERYGRRDDLEHGVCAECLERPEARKHLASPVGARSAPSPVHAVPITPASKPVAVPRSFSQAERALIGKLHAHMPAEQLLDILNTRLVADAGARAVPFTTQQLQEEVARHLDAAVADGDWGGLRKLIARARHAGLLQTITLQLVDDFSVVFRLSPAQHMRLRDVIKSAQEGR
jgi:hypothetical protein